MPPFSSSSSSSSTFKGDSQIDQNDTYTTPFSILLRQYSSGRLSSPPSLLSSPNYSSSSRDDSPLISPSTPLRSFGIPFSWEKLPGIPKKVLSKKKGPPQNALPLPPAARTPTLSKKFNYQNSSVSPTRKKYYNTSQSFKKDPFFAALVECSKDDDQDSIGGKFGSKIPKSLSNRFGFVSMYTSCKCSCPVSESVVYIRRR